MANEVTPQNIIPEVEKLKQGEAGDVTQQEFQQVKTDVSNLQSNKASKTEVAKKATKQALSDLEARVAALESV